MAEKLKVIMICIVLFSCTRLVLAQDDEAINLFMYEPKRINSFEGEDIIRTAAPQKEKVVVPQQNLRLVEDEKLKSVESSENFKNKVKDKLKEIGIIKNEPEPSVNSKSNPFILNDNNPTIGDGNRLNIEDTKSDEVNDKVIPSPIVVDEPKTLFFKDSVIRPIMLEARIDIPMELDLRQVLEIALKNNLDLILSQFDTNIKKWQWYENVGNFLPDLTFNLGWRRFDGTFLVAGVAPVTSNGAQNSANLSSRLSYEFFDGGKKLFNTLAARKLFESAGKNFDFEVSKILLSVTKSYYNLLKEQATLNVLVNTVKEAKENLIVNENLEKRGVGTKFNVLQSKALLAEQEQLLVRQEATFRQASITLSVLLNLKQDNHIKPSVRDLRPKELFDLNTPFDEILAIAKENRSDYKKLKLEYEAKRKLIAAAFSDYLPKANIYGQIGATGRRFIDSTDTEYVNPDVIKLDGAGNPVQSGGMSSTVIEGGGNTVATQVDNSLMSTSTLGVEVNWNVGTGLGVPTLARIKQAKNEAQQFKVKLEKLENQIESEVRFAYLDVQSNNRLLKVSDERVAASKESLRLSKLRLVNGVGINTEVLDSQTAYKEALSSKVNSIVEYNNSQVDLLHKLGVISIDTILPEQNKLTLNY